MKKNLYLLIIVLFLVVVLGIGFVINLKSNHNQDVTLVSLTPTATTSPKLTPSLAVSIFPSPIPSKMPPSYLIANFPFQSQAPLALWDELHDEACEEAALVLVNYYLKGQSLSAEKMDQEILKMVDWEIKNWGSHKDLTISETAELAENFYQLENAQIKNNINIEDIKREVAQNHPVIIPTAGRLLGNPYFRSPGPIYHMLVVIGYDNSTIIVQDIGTRRGDHYRYNEQVLFNAIHDWNGSSENIGSGAKSMLIFN